MSKTARAFDQAFTGTPSHLPSRGSAPAAHAQTLPARATDGHHRPSGGTAGGSDGYWKE
jgi:hypothetical protein